MSFSTGTISEFVKSVNGKIWIALGLFLAGSVLNIFSAPLVKAVSTLMSFFGCGLIIWDFFKLKSMGKKQPAWYTLCIYPWYIRKRGTTNDDTGYDKSLFRASVAVFLISLICLFYGISNGYKSDLAHAAQPVVSDIIHQFNGDVDCVKVYDIDKMANDLYRAKAMLSNTNVVKISIRILPDGTIYVTLLDN